MVEGPETLDPLADLDDAAAATNRKGPTGCVDRAALEHPELTDLIVQAVARPLATGALVARFLQTKGVDISAHAVNRHRRGDCTCTTKQT